MIKDKFNISLITEYTDSIVTYGLETRKGNVQYLYPSLTSNRDKMVEFISTLNRNDFPIDILPELVEDFLENLYGG